MGADEMPPPGRATMQHVAALAGASLKTVSRVVNGESGVSPELQRRVQEAVVRLGYRHNLGASNLRRGTRTASIGVLLQDVANSFCGELLRAVEVQARQRGVVVISASVDDEPERERELVDGLISRRCDGLILMPASGDHGYLLPEIRAGVAVVLVDRRPGDLSLDSVTVDNRAGAQRATQHLLDHGHRRVAALLDDLAIRTAPDRLAGFRLAMDGHGRLDPELEVTGMRNAAEAEAAATALLARDDPPTAFFCGRNEITIGTVRALRRLGLQDRVAVVGFDDFPTADLLQPGVTTLRQDAAREGVLAFELLMARLDGLADPPRAVVLETDLITRGSGEIPGPF